MNAQEKKRLEDLRKAQLAKNGGNGKAAAASKRLDTLGTRRGAPSVPTASSSSSSAPSLPAKSRLAPRKSSASRRIFVPNQKKKAAGKKPTTSIIPTRKTRKFRPNPSSKTPKRRQAQLTSRVAFTASNSRRSTGGWSNTVAKYVKNEAGSIAEVQQAITRREIKKDRNRVKLEAKDDSKQINAMEEEDVEEEEDDEYEGGHESQYPPIILPFDLPVNRQQQQMKEDTVANISKLNRNRSKIIEDDEEEEDDKEDEKEKLKAPKSKLNQIGGSSSSSTCLSLAQHLQRTIKMSQEEGDESPNPEIFFLQLPTALPILDAKEKEADETIKKEEGAITVKSEPMDGRDSQLREDLKKFDDRSKKLHQEQLHVFNDEIDDDIRALPEQAVGMLQIHKSGKVRLKLGDVSLLVTEGAQPAFHQSIFSLDPSKGRACELGDVETRLICSLDVDDLLSGVNNSNA